MSRGNMPFALMTYSPSLVPSFTLYCYPFAFLSSNNVVGVFRGYTSLSLEHERDKEGHVQMGEVVL